MSDDIQVSENSSSLTTPIAGNDIRLGDVILFDEKFPCKIVSKDTAKTGKHGSAKVMLVGVDIFTTKKHQAIGNSQGTFQKVIVDKTEYQLTYIDDDNYVHLATDNGIKEDIQLQDNELGKNIRATFEKDGSVIVTVMRAMNQEMIIDYKKDK